MVASNLIDDKDLCTYALICHESRAVVLSYDGFWRERFTSAFNPSSGKTGIQLMTLYQFRRKMLSKTIDFKDGREADETNCLRVIRDLVVGKRYHSLTQFSWSRLMCLHLSGDLDSSIRK